MNTYDHRGIHKGDSMTTEVEVMEEPKVKVHLITEDILTSLLKANAEFETIKIRLTELELRMEKFKE